MCIRDRHSEVHHERWCQAERDRVDERVELLAERAAGVGRCLLYTSDAADERSSVDLGGRRIIKKKKEISDCSRTDI